MPPTQRPLRLEAAILSRMRSEVTSRSNWANDSSTFNVSRPMDVVVLNCWVTDTKDTLCWSNSSTSLAKSANERVRRSTFVDDDHVDLAGAHVVEKPPQGRPVGVAARNTPVLFWLAAGSIRLQRVAVLADGFVWNGKT